MIWVSEEDLLDSEDLWLPTFCNNWYKKNNYMRGCEPLSMTLARYLTSGSSYVVQSEHHSINLFKNKYFIDMQVNVIFDRNFKKYIKLDSFRQRGFIRFYVEAGGIHPLFLDESKYDIVLVKPITTKKNLLNDK